MATVNSQFGKRQGSSTGGALILLAIAGALAMSAAQTYWWLAPLISFFAFAAVLWLQWGQHKIRALRMRKPFTAHLTVAPEANDSMCFEIHLPPFRDVLLQLRIFPSLHYVQHEMIFGFIGDKNDRPQVVKVVNTFVKVGRDRDELLKLQIFPRPDDVVHG